MAICLYLFFSPDEATDATDLNEEIISMDQIIKRHPYNFLEPSNGQKVPFKNKLAAKNKKNLESWNDIPRQLDQEASSPSLEYSGNEGGNILFFSFHGKVNNANLMERITSQYSNLYVNGGDFLLHKYLTHNSSVEDKWASYDPSELTGLNKVMITDYIAKIFTGFGNNRSEKRKILSVHMTDAWEGGVDISWLISEFQRVGRVTHIVIITRNPIRAKISGETRLTLLPSKANSLPPLVRCRDPQVSSDPHGVLLLC
jgi:hypothetical protein